MKWTGFRGLDGVLGGDLTDSNTIVAMRDKVQHVILLGAPAQLAYERWVTTSWPWGLIFVTLIAIVVELIEQARYDRYGWTRMLSDQADGADIVATIAGGVLAWLLL